MADGQISVELRLLLTKLDQDVKAAVAKINAGFSSQVLQLGKVAGDTGKVSSAMKELGNSTAKTTDKLKQQLEEWRKLGQGGVRIGSNVSLTGRKGIGALSPEYANDPSLNPEGHKPGAEPGGTGAGYAAQVAQAMQTWRTNLSAWQAQNRAAINAKNAVPVAKLLPPVLNQPQGAGSGGSSNWLSNALSQGSGLRGVMSNLMGSSFFYVFQMFKMFGPIVAAVVAGFMILKRVIGELVHSFQQAAALYARAMTSHRPIGWATKEQNLGEIMGVSAESVREFGTQMRWLKTETDSANKSLAANTRVLTATTWHWRAMALEFKALWSDIAAEMAPAISLLLQAVTYMMRLVRETGIWKALGAAIAACALPFAHMVSVLAKLLKVDLKTAVPNATASPNRLQGSAWERMGLVIGVGGGGNPAAETARNTKQTVMWLQKMAHLLEVLNVASDAVAMPLSPVNRP